MQLRYTDETLKEPVQQQLSVMTLNLSIGALPVNLITKCCTPAGHKIVKEVVTTEASKEATPALFEPRIVTAEDIGSSDYIILTGDVEPSYHIMPLMRFVVSSYCCCTQTVLTGQ